MLGFGKRGRSKEIERTEPTIGVAEPRPVRQASLRQLRAVRQHDAAMTDRLTSGWTTTPLTADQIIERNQRILVARSREQSASNDYMKGFLRLCTQNIVGHRGFNLQAQSRDQDGTLDRAANQALEAWWKTWSRRENCDVTGRRSFRLICKAAILSTAKDGEFMIREIRGSAGGPMQYALQVIDPQRCPVDYNVERLRDGRFIRQGIEFTREGRPVAYYFLRGNPANTGYTFNGTSLDRVPAEEIIHGFLEDIIGQRRGIPWAATALWRLHQLSGFEKASLTNARTGASMGGFIEWKDDQGPDLDDEDYADEELYIEHEGGVFQELPPGAEAKPFNSNYPNNEFTPFYKAMLRGAGTGMGVSYVSFANDLEGVNFSSIRQGVLDERDHWMDLQEWLIEVLIDRCYQNALERSLLLGLVTDGKIRLRPERIAKYRNVFWQGRRWAWVDPIKDVQSEEKSKNNLFSAPSDTIRKRGDDPQEVWRKYADDIKAMRAAGIPENYIMASVLGVTPGAASPPPETEETEEEETNVPEPDDD